MLSVLAHNGDNYLGGKDFDWSIVDKIIVPHILQKYSFDEDDDTDLEIEQILKEIEEENDDDFDNSELNNSCFRRGNDKYKTTFHKLKYFAEEAKKYLSQVDEAKIEIENLKDIDEEMYIEIDFSSNELEKLIKPFVDKTIELTKKTIKESGIDLKAINKIILVGGPTKIPYIKKRLSEEFKILVDSTVDPITVVAKGAAIYALSQKVPSDLEDINRSIDAKKLTLHYESLTSETEEVVTGIIDELNNNEEYYLQIQTEDGLFNSPRIKVNNGKFFANVTVEKNKSNLFWIYLFDKNANNLKIWPDSFTITHGLSVPRAPIPHSIGIALLKKDNINNIEIEEIDKIFEKGNVLPLKSKLKTYHTAKTLKKGEDNDLFIILYEGESDIPDRNDIITRLGINGRELPYNLPEGTDVQITVEVNESREIKIDAYIPMIDLWIKEVRKDTYAVILDVDQLREELEKELQRKEKLEQFCTDDELTKINELIKTIKNALNNADSDEDEKRKANSQLKELKKFLDNVEKENEFNQLIKDFNNSIEETQEMIEEISLEKEKQNNQINSKDLKEKGKNAIKNNDKKALKSINKEIEKLNNKVLYANPSTWVRLFYELEEDKLAFIDENKAKFYFNKGHKAIEEENYDNLQDCVIGLIKLLPQQEKSRIKSDISGITY